jgi:hypothetical protein
MVVTWFIIYNFLKQQIMSEYNLDSNLTKVRKITSNQKLSKSVVKQFKKVAKSEELLQRFSHRVKVICTQNEQSLAKAYLHPFQHVNKKLYTDNS